MTTEEYLRPFDEVYEAMRELAAQANTTATLRPPTLYGVLGNLQGAVGSLTEILPSLARATREGASQLELYDSDGHDPHQQLTDTLHTLEDATRAAHQLLDLLNTAQGQIGSVGYRDG